MKRYFEFNHNDYYAMVVTPDRPVETSTHQFIKDACLIYEREVSIDPFESCFYIPSPLTEDEAFMKFTKAQTETDEVGDIIFEFESSSNCVLLIDGSLI